MANKIEEFEMDAHRAHLTADMQALIEKYRSIVDWDVPEVDEAVSRQLILKALRQALDDIDAGSDAGGPG